MRRAYLVSAAAAALAMAAPAAAQQKLKFAHVYEVSEPYHTEIVWAAGEIKKRTANKFEVQVFPASALGNEQQINQALPLGTIDMIYTGVAFAGASHKPIAISNAPYMFRDFDHWNKYGKSGLFKELAEGYFQATKHKIVALTYYGARRLPRPDCVVQRYLMAWRRSYWALVQPAPEAASFWSGSAALRNSARLGVTTVLPCFLNHSGNSCSDLRIAAEALAAASRNTPSKIVFSAAESRVQSGAPITVTRLS